MRIISKFRDYYDGLASHDKNDDLYIRKYDVIKSGINRHHKYDEWYWTHNILIFCNNVYRIYTYQCNQTLHDVMYFYNLDDIDAYYDTQDDNIVKRYNSNNKYSNYTRKWWKEQFSNERYRSLSDTYGKDCLKYNSPIVIHHDNHSITINDRLADWKFYKVKDIYQTYQEIAMWIANNAAKEKPIPTISDKIMAEIKGFDKYSFRKDKATT